MPTQSVSVRIDICVALLIAGAACAMRLAIFDYAAFFQLNSVPNHDTLGATGIFASTLHSLRLSGDLAWWLPGTDGGYPQYYNMFVSPLAPTAGNPPFLIWTEAYRLLTLLGVAIPEYTQFLVFNYILMPVLAYAALVLLCRRFCAGWVGPTLACAAYAFGSPGLWNNAWMFHQEWANVFLFLWAIDLFCRRASTASFALLGVATVFLVASTNYWTAFSLWFLAAWLGFHLYYYFPFWRRALTWLWTARRTPAVLATVLAVGVTGVLWATTIGLVVTEESSNLVRLDTSRGNDFTMEEVYGRSTLNGVRAFTSELFNPIVERPIENYMAINPIHNARYIGMGLLPLLLIFFTGGGWRRGDRLLASMLVVFVAISTTSGLFLLLWQITPGLSKLRHAFYFNQYFLQILLIMIAARTLDHLLRTRRRGAPNVAAICALAGALGLAGIAYIFVNSEQFAARDLKLRSIGYASVLLAISAMLVWRIHLGRGREAAIVFGLMFLALTAGDMLHYYWRGSLADRAFTAEFRGLEFPLPDEVRHAYSSTWDVPAPGDFDGGIAGNQPVKNSLWPINQFNASVHQRRFLRLQERRREKYVLDGIAGLLPPKEELADDTFYRMNERAVTAEIRIWNYNEFDLDVRVARDGLLVTAVAFDEGWEVRVDGLPVATTRVNERLLAFPIGQGRHEVEMVFRPASRQLYPYARYTTLAVLPLLIALAAWPRHRRPRRRRRDETPFPA